MSFHDHYQNLMIVLYRGSFEKPNTDECIEIEPDNMMPYMTGAKVSIFNLKNYSKGFEYLNKHECVKKVIFLNLYFENKAIFQHPRYYEYLAECYSLQSANSRSMAEKRTLNMKALENFRLVARVSFPPIFIIMGLESVDLYSIDYYLF